MLDKNINVFLISFETYNFLAFIKIVLYFVNSFKLLNCRLLDSFFYLNTYKVI